MEDSSEPTTVSIDTGATAVTVTRVPSSYDSSTAWYMDGEDDGTEPIPEETDSHNECQNDSVEVLEELSARHRPSSSHDNWSGSFHSWRQQALDFLVRSEHVFVLEAYMVDEFILQIKVSTNESNLCTNITPWSIVSGTTVSKKNFVKSGYRIDLVTKSILELPSKEFSPCRIVRFILENSNKSVPAIVSSSFTKLMDSRFGEMSLLDYIVYDKRLPGSQRCCTRECGRLASTVHMGEANSPKGLYCATHVKRLGLDSQDIRLYIPLLVAFTTYTRKVVISAMDLCEVYGARARPTLNVNQPVPLPRRWVPLCKKSQPIKLKAKKTLDMYVETAKNVLDCAEEHTVRSAHSIGVDCRHSLTSCLLNAFLRKSGKNTLCEFRYHQKPSEEDLPTNWNKKFVYNM